MWCKLDDLAFYKKGPFGSSLTKAMFVPKSSQSYKVYEQKNAIHKDCTLGSYYITKEKYDSLIGFAVQPYDIIVSCAGTIGETYVLPAGMQEGIINQALMLIRLFSKEIERFYLLYFDFILKDEAYRNSKGTAIKNIPPFDVLKNFFIPIPPIGEQKRILDEVDRLMSFVSTIETGTKNLHTAIKQAKFKILELAIHGKLVSQDPNDEPASELLKRINPKAEIITDNGHYQKVVPFKLPNGWSWTTLGSITNYGSCTTSDVLQIPDSAWVLELEDIEKDSAKILSIHTKKDREIKGVRRSFKKGEILYSKLRTYLNKVLVASQDGFCTTEIIPISVSSVIDNIFLCHVLRSQYFLDYTSVCGYGVKMPRLSTKDAQNGLVPLPPRKEQLRIVSKIEELFHQLDIIEESL
ncbi:restriction endonuclease subunit S [Segatella copri]|uniref:restriction endonuclease subunit S n=1 Tax=Segatella copri TaxID=165179 RepID=UPI002FF0866C